MRQFHKIFSTIVLIMFLGISAYAVPQFYYVQSLKAKVMSGASFKSKLIAEVGKGFKFAVLGSEGNWIKVKYSVIEGYVPSLLLSKTPPLAKQSLIKGEEDILQHNVRRRASTYTSAAAARGLAQDDRRRLSRNEKVDYQSLEKMEALQVTPEEVTRFMEESKL